MSSFLEQLENNEATLLMYLAGELPQADQDEVEQMLQRDASMRATLADLASLQNDLGVSMSIERDVVASRREAAVRQVGRAIAANASRPAAAVAGKIESRRRGLRIAWWAYPVAAAAALVMALLLLAGDPGAVKAPIAEKTVPTPAPQLAIVTPDILPATQSDDALGKLEKELLSLRTTDDTIFGSGASDSDR